MSRVIPPICLWCKHFREEPLMKEHKITCEAYPDSIPALIWDNEFIHQTPYEGDNSIQFEIWENPNHMPEILKMILEDAIVPFNEALEWTITMTKNYKAK